MPKVAQSSPSLGIPASFDHRIGTLGRLEKIVTVYSLLDSSCGRECFVISRVTKIRHNRNDRFDSLMLLTVLKGIFLKSRPKETTKACPPCCGYTTELGRTSNFLILVQASGQFSEGCLQQQIQVNASADLSTRLGIETSSVMRQGRPMHSQDHTS